MYRKLPLIPSIMHDHIYESDSIWDLNQRITSNCMKDGSPDCLQLAEYLIRYQQTITNANYREKLDHWLNECYSLVDRKHPKINASFISRKKTFLRALTKGMGIINEKGNPQEVYDFLALRIILHNDSLEDLYNVCNDIIDYFRAIGLEPVKAHPLKNTNFNQEKFSQIIVPKHSGLKNSYVKYVKDYVLNPKWNGYQSLHLVIRDPRNEYTFEIQIRTQKQHEHDEYSLANHENLREAQIGALKDNIRFYEINPSRLHISGIFVGTIKNGDKEEYYYEDLVGLFDALTMLQRVKTGIHSST